MEGKVVAVFSILGYNVVNNQINDVLRDYPVVLTHTGHCRRIIILRASCISLRFVLYPAALVVHEHVFIDRNQKSLGPARQ